VFGLLRQLVVWLLITLTAGVSFFCAVPLTLPTTPFTFELKFGASLRTVSHELSAQGLLWEPWSLNWAARLMGRQSHIMAGSYQLTQPLTALELLNKLSSHDESQGEVRLIDGMTFAQIRAVLDSQADMQHLTQGLPNKVVLQRMGLATTSAEGLLLPQSYFFSKGGTDLDVLKRAKASMSWHLNELWEKRAAGLPYASPFEALTMASIIEKETARAEERALIAAVFINRLRMGMRLQTDPTVIYGMGSHYHGTVHKKDLLTDTPYNTYTRVGLPPGPIAMPSLAALEATLHPVQSPVLYFVAKGDGSHQFSETLDEHNRAVVKYQLKHH
jgi:UPF0755 protein